MGPLYKVQKVVNVEQNFRDSVANCYSINVNGMTPIALPPLLYSSHVNWNKSRLVGTHHWVIRWRRNLYFDRVSPELSLKATTSGLFYNVSNIGCVATQKLVDLVKLTQSRGFPVLS